MTTSSRRTRRRILGSQTNAATDPTSQCLSRHKHETLLSEYLSFQCGRPVCQHSVSYGFEGQWPLRIMVSTKSLAQSVGIY